MSRERQLRGIAAVAQSLAAAMVGAWAASVVEPPNGTRWLLLAGAIGCAAIVAWARSAGGGGRE